MDSVKRIATHLCIGDSAARYRAANEVVTYGMCSGRSRSREDTSETGNGSRALYCYRPDPVVGHIVRTSAERENSEYRSRGCSNGSRIDHDSRSAIQTTDGVATNVPNVKDSGGGSAGQTTDLNAREDGQAGGCRIAAGCLVDSGNDIALNAGSG